MGRGMMDRWIDGRIDEMDGMDVRIDKWTVRWMENRWVDCG